METESVKPQGLFNRTRTVFKRSVRVTDDPTADDMPFSLRSSYGNVIDVNLTYDLPGFDDSAQVRRAAVDIVSGYTCVQLKIYQVTKEDLKGLLRGLRRAGWKSDLINQ